MAAKQKSVFFCKECGAQSSSWLGKCPNCGAWNSLVEEVIKRDTTLGKTFAKSIQTNIAMPVKDIQVSQQQRLDTSDEELNRVLGGGLVLGSVLLIGGEPGIGKSTLMLQVALNCHNRKILYVSGEESAEQLKMRAERLNATNDNCYILTETDTEHIIAQAEELQPDIIIIDSIQTATVQYIDSSAGSISQIRECAAYLSNYAKRTATPLFLIGHITKDGNIAGPKILEHMVDTVLLFEGDRNYGYRILRSVKNRYGSTSELGIYEMQSYGLRQVNNPSEILLSGRAEQLSGTAIAATVEGSRTIMIETQALVANSFYPTPQRTSTGFDLRRLNMLLAVLEKRAGLRIGNKDVFLNIAGGIRVFDTATDLAIIASLISSSQDTAISSKYCFAAEVGLSSEVRPVTHITERISEADKLGFERIFISKYNLKGLNSSQYHLEIVPLAKIEDLLKYIL
ncbi:MAG: DNA repair protein RadA [Bacteroidales bacterium]|jgi:DNA repair protein RadA/Sms|nr:DNA repair protein RadA [Bacteroidales bacterium]